MPQHHLLPSLTAAITGGTTGIGRAIALEFLRQGCNVAINHLNLPSDAHHKASLLALAAEIRENDKEAGRLIEVEGDVSKPETGKLLVERAVEEFGGLDVFVSNAGVCQFAEFLEYVFFLSPLSVVLDKLGFCPFFILFPGGEIGNVMEWNRGENRYSQTPQNRITDVS
jgi:L-rhamnose 1-dehydrogenase